MLYLCIFYSIILLFAPHHARKHNKLVEFFFGVSLLFYTDLDWWEPSILIEIHRSSNFILLIRFVLFSVNWFCIQYSAIFNIIHCVLTAIRENNKIPTETRYDNKQRFRANKPSTTTRNLHKFFNEFCCFTQFFVLYTHLKTIVVGKMKKKYEPIHISFKL